MFAHSCTFFVKFFFHREVRIARGAGLTRICFADTATLRRIVRNSATEVRKYTLGWAEDILKELLNLVDIRLDLAIEGYEGRVRARRQVLEVCGLPGREVKQVQRVTANRSE